MRLEQLESRSMLAADFGDVIDDPWMAFDWDAFDPVTFDEATYGSVEPEIVDDFSLMGVDSIDPWAEFTSSNTDWESYFYSAGFDWPLLDDAFTDVYDVSTFADYGAADGESAFSQNYDYGDDSNWWIGNFPIDVAPPASDSDPFAVGLEGGFWFVDDESGGQQGGAWDGAAIDVGGSWWWDDRGVGSEIVSDGEAFDDPSNAAFVAERGDAVSTATDETFQPLDQLDDGSGWSWDDTGDGTGQVYVFGDTIDQPPGYAGDTIVTGLTGSGGDGGDSRPFADDGTATSEGSTDQSATTSAAGPRAAAFADMRMLSAAAATMASAAPEVGMVGVGGRRRR